MSARMDVGVGHARPTREDTCDPAAIQPTGQGAAQQSAEAGIGQYNFSHNRTGGHRRPQKAQIRSAGERGFR